jgi:protein SCO1/2
MKWHSVRTLTLALISLLCLGFTASVVYTLLIDPDPIDIPIGGPFDLVDQSGTTVTDAAFRGRYMLIYFGYTYCPDICPTKLAEMTNALDSFAEQAPARAAKIAPIFVSIDPDRDTLEVLREYRKHFHPRLVALTGSEAKLRAAAKAYRAYFSKVYPDKKSRAAGEYLMDHTSYVYLMGPDGRYVTHFTAASTAKTMAERLATAVD